MTDMYAGEAHGAPPPTTWVQMMALSQITKAPRNPKAHDLAVLDASLQRFGYAEHALVNEATGRLVAGHGRLETLALAKQVGKDPPRRVKVKDGEWWVPVLRGVAFDSEEEAEAYLITSNQSTIGPGWDDAALADVLADHEGEGLWGTGFDDSDRADLLTLLGPPNLDDLAAEHGDPSDEAVWPTFALRVPPLVKAAAEGVMRQMAGESEADRFAAMVAAAQVVAEAAEAT